MKKGIIFCGIMLLGALSHAQDTIQLKPDKPISLAYYPFMHISQALKISVELPIANHGRIQFAPHVYSGFDYYEQSSPPQGVERSQEQEDFRSSTSGFGFETMYCYSPKDWMYDESIFYVGAGGGIHSITFNYDGYDYFTESQNGLDFIRFGYIQTSDRLLRTDVFGVVGIRSRGSALLGFDLNMGVSYKHTDVKNLDSYEPRDVYEEIAPAHGGNGFCFRIQASLVVNFPKRDRLLQGL